MSNATSPLSLLAFKGPTVLVSTMDAGHLIRPPTIIVQSPRSGQDKLDVHTYSFLIENERAGKKVLFKPGIMKA